jgi:hypothetical protein
MIVGALGAVGVLGSACSSSNGAPAVTTFTAAECQGGLTEIARFTKTLAPLGVTTPGTANNLSLDGDTLYVTYTTAGTDSGLPLPGGIVAIAVDAAAPAAGRVVAAADSAQTASWDVDSFWVSGGQIYLQAGTTIGSVPANPTTPSTLTYVSSNSSSAAYVHDADFGYSATIGGNGVTVAKTPIAGGTATVLVSDATSSAPSWLGGMADTGDAVLLQVGFGSSAPARVWRIPKDGSPRSDERPDIQWADPIVFPQWLGWDGTDIIGPALVQNTIVQSRVSATGTSAPVQTKLGGNIATLRNDEILSFQLMSFQAPEPSSMLLVASSKGSPAGTALACSGTFVGFPGTPTGIAANDRGIYVAYWTGDDLVIARVSP